MVRKAVVMAGGLATRLRPLTTATNKHMLPLYDRPMIQHVIETVVASGITDIVVHLNAFPQPVIELLKDGQDLGCSIYYSYQSMGDSVAKQLRSVRHYLESEPFMLMLGDSWYRSPLALSRATAPHMWVMPLNGFDDFRKYAEVTLKANGRVTHIVEKPERPVTNIIQTGAWVFPPDVFDRAERLVKETPHEVQVRTIVREYVREGHMSATMLPGRSFLDCGTVEALYLANSLVREQRLATKEPE